MLDLKKKNSLKLKALIIIFFLFTLLLGFYFSENSSGGAYIDYTFLNSIVTEFSKNIHDAFYLFLENNSLIIHSPIFYIILGTALKITGSYEATRILYIIFCSILPLIFYKILKKKYPILNNNFYLFIFANILFLSPYFRSSAIWALGDNLSLIFFTSFVFFLNQFSDYKKTKDLYLSAIFIIFASYIRYYYAVYFVLIFYYLIKDKKILKVKFLSFFLLFCLFLGLPAFIYFYLIIQNYNFLNTLFAFGNFNIFKSTYEIIIIVLFFNVPLLLLSFKNFIEYYLEHYKITILIFLISILIYLINFYIFKSIDDNVLGGGVFKKIIVNILNLKSYYLFPFFLISFFFLDFIFKSDRVYNYLVLILMILSLPFSIMFQKYLDPLFLIILYGLISSKYIKDLILNIKFPLKTLYLYFSFYLFFAIIYYN